MRIQNNITAINAYRNLRKNTSALSKNLEKLASGFQINRSADDAAGLAISEKMRALIRGLDAAYKNCQDAVSMVQTAEGALQEVHAMLQRMNELALQSSNGTYEDAVDRNALQQEFQQIQEEIDRIGSATDFNGMKLFDGSGGTQKPNGTDNPSGMPDGTVSLSGRIGGTAITANVNLEELANNASAGDKVIIDGKEYTYSDDADGTGGATFKDWDTLRASALVNGVMLSIVRKGGTQQTQTLTAANNAGDAVVGPATARYTSGEAGMVNYSGGKSVNVDVTYLDAGGAEQTVTVNFSSTTSLNGTVNSLINTLKGNGSLSALFDISADQSGKRIVFVSKAGAGQAVVTNLVAEPWNSIDFGIGSGTITPATSGGFAAANWSAGDSVKLDGVDYTFTDYSSTDALKTALEDAGITVTENGGIWSFSKTETVGGTTTTSATKVNSQTPSVTNSDGAGQTPAVMRSAAPFSVTRAATTVTAGAFTLTGDNLIENTDYSYSNNTLTILSDKAITISGTTTTDHIDIGANVTANIELQNLSIDRSSAGNSAALYLAENSTLSLTLTGRNTLKSGSNMAGLQMRSTSTLIITEGSTGSLDAVGGVNGSGIGGGGWGDGWNGGGKITISGGTVTATGGDHCAGIGGGSASGSGGTITINGGMVTATGGGGSAGGGGGAGIGGGSSGAGGTITISGGTVTANGGRNGAAGIGGGAGGAAGTFTTGTNGNATITASNIADTSDQANWSGWINGVKYGNPVLQGNSTINLSTLNGNNLEITDTGYKIGSTEYMCIGPYTFTGSTSQNITVSTNTTINMNGVTGGDFTVTGNSTVNVALTGTNTFDNIKVENGSTLNTSGSGKLVVKEKLDNDGTVKNGSTIENDGTVENSGNFDNDGTLDNDGTVKNETGGSIDNSGNFDNDGTLDNDGTVNNEAGGKIDNGGTINNSGTLDNDGTVNNNSGGTINNQNGGTIDNGSGSQINNDGDLTNEDGGTVNNDGTIDNGGDLTNGGTLNNDGQLDNTGSLDNGGSLNNSGTVNNENGGQIDNTGTVDNGGTLNNGSGSTINNENGGQIDNSGTVDNSGDLTNGGTVKNNTGGTVNNNTGGSIDNTGGTFDNTDGEVKDNGGTVTGSITGNQPTPGTGGGSGTGGGDPDDPDNPSGGGTGTGGTGGTTGGSGSGQNVWVMQIGPNASDQMELDIGLMNTTVLKVDKASVNISSQSAASSAIDPIKDAINSISTQRARLGAYQNRLEHTMNNLSVTRENTQFAESRIRDTDMAEEMMAYTKNNILIQSAQAMLAQANLVPEMVLTLLR